MSTRTNPFRIVGSRGRTHAGDFDTGHDFPFVERVKGIEPSSLAWEARALPLSYTRDAPGL
jgi:hypothetical protein